MYPKACPKNTRMIQNLNLLAGLLRESDCDSAERTEGEDKVPASSVI